MGMLSRRKGKAAEAEIAAIIRDLTGWEVWRRVRQHDGDSDLVGVEGWIIEVKRHAKASPADLRTWWAQAVAQSQQHGGAPVLLYRANRGQWRAVWPLAVLMTHQSPDMWTGYEWTADTSVEAWVSVIREAACK